MPFTNEDTESFVATLRESADFRDQVRAIVFSADFLRPPTHVYEMREVVIEAREFALEARDISIESRDIAFDGREVARESREIARESRPIAIESRDLARRSIEVAIEARDSAREVAAATQQSLAGVEYRLTAAIEALADEVRRANRPANGG